MKYIIKIIIFNKTYVFQGKKINLENEKNKPYEFTNIDVCRAIAFGLAIQCKEFEVVIYAKLNGKMEQFELVSIDKIEAYKEKLNQQSINN
ncbi:MAG: hypothetical protein ACKVOU_03610 [Cytophagales bacterium]